MAVLPSFPTSGGVVPSPDSETGALTPPPKKKSAAAVDRVASSVDETASFSQFCPCKE